MHINELIGNANLQWYYSWQRYSEHLKNVRSIDEDD